MRLLIIGGTRFVGRIVLENLVKEHPNYKITIFNRGITNKNLFKNQPNIEFIKGDRETNDIAQLFNRKWDVVLDFMGYFPDSLEYLLTNIHTKIGKYIFISTISTYDLEHPTAIPVTERGKLLKWTKNDRNDTTWDSYGKRKVACETAIEKFSNLDHVILRPSLIYGQYDYTERLYHWLYQLKHKSLLEVPIEFNKLVNYTFANDFVKVIIHFIEASHQQNCYNVVTHKAVPLTQLLNDSKKWIGSDCEIISKQINATNETEIPLWFPKECLEISSESLLKELPFNFTKFEDSIEQTVQYCNSINWPAPSFL